MFLYRVSVLNASTLTEQGVSSFIPDFKIFVNDASGNIATMTETGFYGYLYTFLCSTGAAYQGSIKWKQNFNCSISNPNAKIHALTFDYSHRHNEISTDLIDYMYSVTNIIDADTTLGVKI